MDGKNIIRWQSYIDKFTYRSILGVDSYFYMFEDVSYFPAFVYPFRVDVGFSILCKEGSIRGKYGMKEFTAAAPCLLILQPEEIIQIVEVSSDFSGFFLVHTKEFNGDLNVNIKERLQLSLSAHAAPIITLTNEEMQQNLLFFHVLEDALKDRENPHLRDIVLHYVLAFYFQMHGHLTEKTSTHEILRAEDIFAKFMTLVEQYYKEERKVTFYADKLAITPKYLSSLIKQKTGRTANQWIDEYVMLEAKALLNSSSLTIQRISDILHFPDQSVFGKFFKKHEGVSPTEYRK